MISEDNMSISVHSKYVNYNKPMNLQLNKVIDRFKLNFFLRIKNYLFEKMEVEGLPDNFDKYQFLDKVFNGSMALLEFRKKLWPVNITILQFNFINEPVKIKVIEPLSNLLNGMEYVRDEFGEFNKIHEVRFNYDRNSLWYKIYPFLDQLEEVWNVFIADNRHILDKFLINGRLLKQEQLEQVLNQIVTSKGKTIHVVDFDTSVEDIVGDQKNLMIQIPYNQFSTDRVIKKYEFIIKEAFKEIGIPFNNQADKKGANVIEKEITTETETTEYIFKNYISVMNNDLEKFSDIRVKEVKNDNKNQSQNDVPGFSNTGNRDE